MPRKPTKTERATARARKPHADSPRPANAAYTDRRSGRTPAIARPPHGRFTFIPSGVFAGGDYHPRWLVRGVLVKGQPAVVAGPAKSLKTSLLIDLAVSLASGRPFLGEFATPEPVRVVLASGESGEHTLQETARRVCAAKGVELSELGDNLSWCATLPTLSDRDAMAEFADGLAALGAEVVILDPLYLCLGDIDAKNLFEMGAALRVVADILSAAGCSLIFAHHANRTLTTGGPMELLHLAYSGLEQFARQFLLVNRRLPYRSDGVHQLWVRVGGSCGHGGLWAVRVEEGVTGDDFGNRIWAPTVRPANDLSDGRATGEAGRRKTTGERMARDCSEVLKAIEAETADGRAGTTKSRIKDRCPNLSGARLNTVLDALTAAGKIESIGLDSPGGRRGRRQAAGFRRVACRDGEINTPTGI